MKRIHTVILHVGMQTASEIDIYIHTTFSFLYRRNNKTGTILSFAKSFVLTNQLAAWGRLLLRKLTDTELVKIYPALYRNRRFMTIYMRADHWPLSGTWWIQCTCSYPVSELRFNFILQILCSRTEWQLILSSLFSFLLLSKILNKNLSLATC